MDKIVSENNNEDKDTDKSIDKSAKIEMGAAIAVIGTEIGWSISKIFKKKNKV
jgi:hypothetical protein